MNPFARLFIVVLFVFISIHNVHAQANDENVLSFMPAIIAGNQSLITGIWNFYDTTEPGANDPLGVELQDNQGQISGQSCDNPVTITGSRDKKQITITMQFADGAITATGTVIGNEMSGTWTDSIGESGTWKALKTNDPKCILSVRVATQNNYPNTYSLGITLDNIDVTTVSSVNVTGPNISTIWKYLSNHWVVTLSSRPIVGDTYSIAVYYHDSTNETKQYVVNGVNDNFAWLTSPGDGSNISTTLPTFVWQEAVNADHYSIGLHGAGNVFIWDKNLSSGTSSCQYDGPALQSGITYIVYMHSFDSNGNQAQTQSVFTVQ